MVNFSLARSINLNSERRRLEFRIDSTNMLNHVNPTGLITVVNSSQYGLITSAGDDAADYRYREIEVLK